MNKSINDEYVYLRVSVAWDVESDEALEDFPGSVYIKVPSDIYESDVDMNLSGMIEDYFGCRVDDIYPTEVNKERDLKRIKDWLLWTDDGLVEDIGMVRESKNMVNEGAGAGYTVHINGLKFGKIFDYKWEKGKKSWEDSCKVKVEVVPGDYEIGAEDYDNDFFWQEHEFGDTPEAKIDGGYAIFDIALDGNPDEDDEALFQMNRELENRELDISFDYGWGWSHANLPREEEIESDHVDIEGSDVYFSIDKLVLNAPDLADAVNSGYESTFDQGEDSEEDEEDSEQ